VHLTIKCKLDNGTRNLSCLIHQCYVTGRIAEYDEPSRLLEREDSFFFKLIKEYSGRSHSFNNLATQHVQSREQL